MRLIDADALADALFEQRKNYPQWVADTIGNMPDAVVRCKNCKYWHKTIYDTPKWLPCMSVKTYGNWFCADGVRKE